MLRLRLPSIHAIRAVETALQAVEGIVHAEVTRAGVSVDHDGRATADRLRAAVAASGFDIVEIVEEGRRLAVRDNEE
jgi:copper chaperone CopZ